MRGSQSAASHSVRSHICELRGIFCDAHVATKNDGNILRRARRKVCDADYNEVKNKLK